MTANTKSKFIPCDICGNPITVGSPDHNEDNGTHRRCEQENVEAEHMWATIKDIYKQAGLQAVRQYTDLHHPEWEWSYCEECATNTPTTWKACPICTYGKNRLPKWMN